MNITDAKKAVEDFFNTHGSCAKTATSKAKVGKVYELYCIAKTLEELKATYGVTVQFVGPAVQFKASPGKIDRTKSYFIIERNGHRFELHTDIEVRTLGSTSASTHTDLSAYHEIDIVVVPPSATDRPDHYDVLLGVECKAHANFGKGIVKQVLGIRRELSLLTDENPACLAHAFGFTSPMVPSYPPSEYWLAYIDPKGSNYSQSPGVFGIRFEHWCP
ncbi:hypothetical protein [Nereida sp. MMG025]|uniref:hypothetical protein n=1 Tax=Nereida sp. MMG025 TaxID=2909981 RepID=UPI001F3A840B|nr:hypothetical protein [Nereida sp. MMG025]MCF6446150.1 hypothetical protein [Nereida sp. MMG025]